MTVSVGLFDAGYARLKSRIDGIGLDIDIVTFDKNGEFDLNGKKTPASEIELDYLWLSPDLAGGRLGKLLGSDHLRRRSLHDTLA